MSTHLPRAILELDEVVIGPGFAQLSLVDIDTMRGNSAIVPIELMKEAARLYRKSKGSRHKKHARSQHAAVELSRKAELSDDETMGFVWAIVGCTLERADNESRKSARRAVDDIIEAHGSVRIIGVENGAHIAWTFSAPNTLLDAGEAVH